MGFMELSKHGKMGRKSLIQHKNIILFANGIEKAIKIRIRIILGFSGR